MEVTEIMGNYFQQDIECASREQIRKWQDERLVRQVKNVYDNVPYYRTTMDNMGLKPEDIKSVDDLHKLPFITKDDLRDAILTGCLPVRCQTVCAFSLPAVRRVAASLLFIRSMTLIYGRSAVPARL